MYCQTVSHPLGVTWAFRNFSFSLSLFLSLSLNPASALVSPSPFRRVRAIDSPPLVINRSSSRRVSHHVTIVGQDHLALARPHIATSFACRRAQKRSCTTNVAEGITEERHARSVAAVAVAGVAARSARYPCYFANGASLPPLSPTILPFSLHLSLPHAD